MLYQVRIRLFKSLQVNFIFRRDKKFCHECRFCCSLSICTKKDGTSYFRNESWNGLFMNTFSAAQGYTVDLKYRNDLFQRERELIDFRCLKPKPGVPSSKWPHYDMKQHRAATTLAELQQVDEITFDKESFIYFLE